MGARAAAAAACLAAWGAGGPPGIPAAAAPVPTRPPVEVTGATRIEYDAAARQWTFSGPRVVIVRASTRLEAGEIAYNELAREVVLSGDAAVFTPTLEVTADRMTSLLDARHVTAEGHVAGRFADEARQRWGTFSADRVEVDDRADLRQIVATGQVVVQGDDRRLRGDRIVYNRLTQQGTADGHVELAQGRDSLRAGHVFADFARRLAAADDDVLMEYGDIHGSADHATYSGEEQTAVLWGHVRVRRGRDTLSADRVTAFLDRDAAIAQGHVRLLAYAGEPSP